MSHHRLLIVTPVRNEGAHLAAVVVAMAAQTRPPDCWIVVDDGSDDDTPRILSDTTRDLPFLRVVSTPPAFTPESDDRLAVAAAPRAFNYGLGSVGTDGFTHIGKLDGDIELPPDYFERLLAEFDADPGLGIGGGTLVEPDGAAWRATASAPDHVRGALKLYARPCFDAIGGVEERLGWDGIDEIRARMRGWRTRSFDDLVARHHRPTGAADGRMRGHARWGAGHYVLGYHPLWVLARSVKTARLRPYGVSGLGYVYGYARAAVRRTPQTGDPDERRHLRLEQRRRILTRLRPPRRPVTVRPKGDRKFRPQESVHGTMEFARLLRELWSRKLVMALGLLVALFLSVSTVYSVSLLPFSLEKKSLVFSTAKTQVFVDSPSSSIADLDRDLGPLIARAGVYSRFLTSPGALKVIGDETGIPGTTIYAKGPFELNQPRIEQEPTAERRGDQIVGEKAPYKLRFESNPQLPIVTIFSEAPTTKDAIALANGAARGLETYVSQLESQERIPPKQRVEIRQLGEPVGGEVNPGTDKKVAVFVFIFVFGLWSLAALALPRFATAWRATDEPPPAPSFNGSSAPNSTTPEEIEARLERVS